MTDPFIACVIVLQESIKSAVSAAALATAWGDADTIAPVVLPPDIEANQPNYVQVWPMPVEVTTTADATGKCYQMAQRIAVRIFMVHSDRARANMSARRVALSIMAIAAADPTLGRTAYDVRPSMDAPEIGTDDSNRAYAACTVFFDVVTDGLFGR